MGRFFADYWLRSVGDRKVTERPNPANNEADSYNFTPAPPRMNTSNLHIPYSREDLFRRGTPRVYHGRQLDQIAFPLGGIGTGCISLGGWGQLRDFEIFNRPQKGLSFERTFFTLFAQKGTDAPVTRVLQGPVGGDNFTGNGFGIERHSGAGLPHFRSVEFVGAFPIARLKLDDDKVPLTVSLEALNPFIPLNPDDSGLPVAMLLFQLANPTDEPVHSMLYASLENKTGYPEVGGGLIECFEDEGVRGLKMSTRKHSPDSPRFGTLALATPHEDVVFQTHGFRGSLFDNLHRFWDQACRGELEEIREPAGRDIGTDVGTIALRATVPPGETAQLHVWLVWHTPNFEKYWHPTDPKPVWRNYYATRFEDAVAVAMYVAENHQRLISETRLFTESLFSSTLPAAVLDAVSSQLSILKSPTCLRLEDGTFYGWEGCHGERGCCEGTCSHVWNYAQAVAYLFPSLERSVRETDYRVNLSDDGYVAFRTPLPLGEEPASELPPAADGQVGGILRVYREWQICGDDAWLRSLWPKVKRALEYAWTVWDRDRDGVMEGLQHNTYDVEFYGPNPLTGGLYLAALRAAEEMARHLGEPATAEEYRAVFEKGRAWMDTELFNGEYYVQQVRPEAARGASHPPGLTHGGQGPDPALADTPKYQLGSGCLSDQMIGQWYARMLRLGDLFETDHIRQALASVFRFNWKSDLRDHANPQRIYAVNEEAGLLLATWPRGGRPGLPFPYSDEVWCGVEYQVASHLIYEGFVEEGLAVVKGARDRYTGERRNPWDEIECGHHYARSLASYALLLALADFFYSAPQQLLRFSPGVYPENFACFFSVGSGWGMVRQTIGPNTDRVEVEVLYGELRVRQLDLGISVAEPRVIRAGEEINASAEPFDGGIRVWLSKTVTIRAGQSLVVTSGG